MSETLHPLADRYLDALYDLPDTLRVRRAVENEVAMALTSNHHACIRGFWRTGKTTLLQGVLQNCAERTDGVAFMLDLRDPERDDGLPQSAEAVLGRVAAKVTELLNRAGATELKVDPARPLEVLGELAAPIFVGFDEAIALHALGAEKAKAVLDVLLTVPRNVKVAIVCHRHRDVDALFEEVVCARPQVVTVHVAPVTDEELVHLVNTPALEHGVRFEDEALGAVAELSGNRPFEIVSLCAVLAQGLPVDFKGSITPAQVEALFDLDTLSAVDEGKALIDNYLRTLVTALTPEERELVDVLVTGKEAEVAEDAIQRLADGGWVVDDEGLAINGGLLEGIARAVAEGVITVAVG